MSSEIISFLMKNVNMYFKKRTYGIALLNNVTHMRPVQISVKPMQNLPVTSRDESYGVLRGLTLHSLDSDT